MNPIRKIGFLSLVTATVLLVTACPSRTTINKINADPAKYKNKDVGIVGTVTDSYGALGNGAYELDDGTGKIWVVTSRGVPARGARIGASGRVHTAFAFGGRSFGTVLQETDRRAKE